MERLVERFAGAGGVTADLLRQAAREALLLQSSDWPFLVTTGQAREYAISRFEGHVERFNQLGDLLESENSGPEARSIADELYERDRLFSEIDPRLFADGEGADGRAKSVA